MIALIQRVNSAEVRVDSQITGSIKTGILLFLGIEKNDEQKTCEKMLSKILNYRIFADNNNKMNLSLLDTNKELLVISQFTLAANTNSGNRPSFSDAKEPVFAKKLYDYFVTLAAEKVPTQTGIFAADMKVFAEGDGPVNFVLKV